MAFDGGGVCRHTLESRAAEENLAEHPHGERPRTNGGVAHLDIPQTHDEPLRDGGHARPIVSADEKADGLPHVVVALVVVLQVGSQALAAHVLDNLFGCVICALVLVVFQQVLEYSAEHLGIHAHLGVVGGILVDGEVVLREHREQVGEIVGREAARLLVVRAALEEAAIEIGDSDAAQPLDAGIKSVRHIGAVGVESLKERLQDRVEEVGLLPLRGFLEEA